MSGDLAPDIPDQGTGTLTLPGSGTSRVRARGTFDTEGADAYQFLTGR